MPPIAHMIFRPLNLPELGLLIFLLRDYPAAERLLPVLHTTEVVELSDGGSGSLRFINHMPNRRLGEKIAGTQNFLTKTECRCWWPCT